MNSELAILLRTRNYFNIMPDIYFLRTTAVIYGSGAGKNGIDLSGIDFVDCWFPVSLEQTPGYNILIVTDIATERKKISKISFRQGDKGLRDFISFAHAVAGIVLEVLPAVTNIKIVLFHSGNIPIR